MSSRVSEEYDAVLIPGGGLHEDGELPPWVRVRLDEALAQRTERTYLIPLSRGTTHKAPPLDSNGRPLDESRVAADYFLERGVPARRILPETVSLDTIGNAFFARLLHTDPLGLRELLIITSEFHMPRTRRIFEAVYELDYEIADRADIAYRLTFQSVPDQGLSESALRARLEKEKSSLESFETFMKGVDCMEALHERIHEQHAAYAADGRPVMLPTDELAESY